MSSNFTRRHIGTNKEQQNEMLVELGVDSIEGLIEEIIPADIYDSHPLDLSVAIDEEQALLELRAIATKNRQYRSFIGLGYYPTYTPKVILRNVLENPAWYTAYTPYQAEISQGRLEVLFHFQTMICELTGLDTANASLLDEATAAAEAMTLCRRASRSKSNIFLVDSAVMPQTIEVLRTRVRYTGIELRICDLEQEEDLQSFGVLLQYPTSGGKVSTYDTLIERLHSAGSLVVLATDLLSLMLLRSPAEMGADIAVGNSQRFGVPLGCGGPHAAFIATRGKFIRNMPGRIVGLSVDSHGKPAYRLALQTREQHIRREKATSNICTAQTLLAVMATFYAIYHGPQGLLDIAERVHRLTTILATGLVKLGFKLVNKYFFDTLSIKTGEHTSRILQRADEGGINLRHIDTENIGLSLDEITNEKEIEILWAIFAPDKELNFASIQNDDYATLPQEFIRKDGILQHEVFCRYHSETAMLRYIHALADMDLSLSRTMIPLGSCTMKLNATAAMIPVSWPEFADIHPFAPQQQIQGYKQLVAELAQQLCAITGYSAVSLQPNSGSQGEFAGLRIVRAYHESIGQGHRNICLIPISAHGTNPATAKMCGLNVVEIACDRQGNVSIDDIKKKAKEHADNLAVAMLTYPSTHGVFEDEIRELCNIVHNYGGQVYIDGANFNAMAGLCSPGRFGGDVSHLNLHKTFCIPHGGGGPGVGPVVVAEHLQEFLPASVLDILSGSQMAKAIGPITAAPWGSAGILPISWMYIKMTGASGQKEITQAAILNANYIALRLQDHFPILYRGINGYVAHECIIDLRGFKKTVGISAEDVAKRLIDFGFHAPTMSFPVIDTLMIEPTESESKLEIDRFCEAMIVIRKEIAALEKATIDSEDNPLKNAPHTISDVLDAEWLHPYSRQQACCVDYQENKYWAPVNRVDNVHGDRNLICKS